MRGWLDRPGYLKGVEHFSEGVSGRGAEFFPEILMGLRFPVT